MAYQKKAGTSRLEFFPSGEEHRHAHGGAQQRSDYRVILFAAVFGLGAWLIYRIVDAFFFHDQPFWRSLVVDASEHEIYTSLFILMCFVVFGYLMSRVLARHKMTEKRLREYIYFMENMFETTIDGICIADAQGNIVRTNKTVGRLLGYTASELSGKRMHVLIGDDEHSTAQRTTLSHKLRTEGAVKNQEIDIICKDGSTVPVEVSVTLLKDLSGEVTGGVSFIRDISGRRQVENSLRYRFELEKLVADISSSFVNRPWDETDTGISNALQALGEFVDVDYTYVFLFYDNITKMKMAYEWAADGNEPNLGRHHDLKVTRIPWIMDRLRRFESVYVPDMNDILPIITTESEHRLMSAAKSYVAVPIVDSGELVGFTGLISVRCVKKILPEDIALFKTVGEIFINSLRSREAEEIRISEKLKAEFINNITHEFRTPLTLALGPLEEVLKDKSLQAGTQHREFLKLAYNNVGKLLRLVNQLLDFSSIDAGAAFVSYQKHDLCSFVAALVDFFTPLAQRKNITLRFESLDGDCSVYVDPEKMDKVIINVLGNAVKFTPIGGVVEVACRAGHSGIAGQTPADYIEIVITDNGPGIKQEDLGKIFQRFYRGRSGPAARLGGSGIGLSYAKSLIEVQGGSIHAESSEEEGATFYIRIPRGKGHIQNEALIREECAEVEVPRDAKLILETMDLDSEDTEDIKLTGDRPLLLIVDDNRDVRAYVRGVLASEFDIITARDGSEALTLAGTYSPDLIISDILMPGMDGYEFCRELKKSRDFSHIPFIFLTAKTDIEAGLEEGADDYLVKPFSSCELKARIRALLKNRKLIQENIEKKDRIFSLTQQLETKFDFQNIVTQDKAMFDIFNILKSIRDTDHPVLISGETGTGKELIAKSLHFTSFRKDNSFIVRNCSAFSEQLLESEVFGHVKGAFTGAVQSQQGIFELAHGGTLFLDEIGDMSLNTQAKLLRVLEYGKFYPIGGSVEKSVDVRLITATNRDLHKMVEDGLFRKDLYYRLNVLCVALPLLCERKGDILLLAEHFLNEMHALHGKRKRLSKQAEEALTAYRFPGNIRELQNVIQKLYLLSPKRTIHLRDLSPELKQNNTAGSTRMVGSVRTGLDSVKELERQTIMNALKAVKNNKTSAAHMLKISIPTLYKRIKDYHIDLNAL